MRGDRQNWGRKQGGDPSLQQAQAMLSPLKKELEQLSEKILTLNGERAGERAAVRRQLLTPLVELRREPTSSRASAAPTQDEFNELVDDVRALYLTLARISALLEGSSRG